MTDMRRSILWGVFLFSLFMLYDGWLRHTGQPSLMHPAPATAPAKVSTSAGASSSAGLPTPSGTPVATAAPAAPAASAAAPVKSESVTITTDVMRATLDSRGGELQRVDLLTQKDPNDPTKPVTVLGPEHHYFAETGLVPPAGGAGLPNQHTLMALVPGPRALADGSNTLQVRFESPEVGGVKLVKTYTFARGSYLVGVKHEVVNAGTAPVNPQLYLQLTRDNKAPAGESSMYFTFTGPVVYTDAHKFKKIDWKSIDKRKPGEAPDHDVKSDNGWVGMVQHYFASAWLIDPAEGPKVPREYYTGKAPDNADLYVAGMFVPLGQVAPGMSKTFDAELFVGPQEENKLEAMKDAKPIKAEGLELVKDYGWLTILSKPLFWLLTQFHKVLGNWGWAIVALVVSLRIAFYWLNVNAYRSMAKMKAVNPKIQELRERYKDKPQQLQQEMMRIYREEKINPLGGCLPIFVQMPFFIALYWVLLSSVEMRGAPWIGWITDLSAKDPFYILPILMTGSSLLQTWLNPTPPDPVQARMMWIMPLVFSVMFFVFPAGLVLYWLTNNILAIAQQYLINRQLGVTK